MKYSDLIGGLRSYLDERGDLHPAGYGVGICNLKNIGPLAFLHTVFNGVDYSQISEFEKKNGIEIPLPYKDVLTEFNGAILFGGRLSLFGIARNFSRSSVNRQPFDILEQNKYSSPPDNVNSNFYIGSSSVDGSLFSLKTDSRAIHRRSRASGEIIKSWDNFDCFIIEEIMELSKGFDRKGLKISSHSK